MAADDPDPEANAEPAVDAAEEAPVRAGAGADDGGPVEQVSSALTDTLVKAIAYVATGAGFLTFVGATGAAVTWILSA